MSDVTIAKLPFRTYAQIPALQYNTLVSDDIKELPRFLNVNHGALKHLAGVTFQNHKPNESLRTVPWIKPSGFVAPDTELDRGAYLFNNGLWINLIPEFEKAEDFQDILDAAYTPADDPAPEEGTLVEARDAARAHRVQVLASLVDTIAAWSATRPLAATALESRIRAQQLAMNSGWMWGTGKAIIPPGKGRFVPTETPHAVISFVGNATTLRPSYEAYMTDVYQAFNLPCWTMIQNNFMVQRRGFELTDNVDLDAWNWFRSLWTTFRTQNPTPVPNYAYPAYTDVEWAQTFGYYYSENGVAGTYQDPVVFLEITGDTHPQNWGTPTIRLDNHEVGSGDPLDNYIAGFGVWFSNYVITAPPPALAGHLELTQTREIDFNWTAYGKRRTPPELWT